MIINQAFKSEGDGRVLAKLAPVNEWERLQKFAIQLMRCMEVEGECTDQRYVGLYHGLAHIADGAKVVGLALRSHDAVNGAFVVGLGDDRCLSPIE